MASLGRLVGSFSTARHLATRAAKPFDHWTLNALGAIGAAGVTGAPVVLGDVQAAALVLFVILASVLGYAAYGLQREADERASPSFRVDALEIERLGPPWRQPNDGRTWWDLVAVRIAVHNDGPTARFAARIENVRGVRQLGNPDALPTYRVPSVAWEDTKERDFEIFGGDNAHLMVASHGKWKVGSDSGMGIWFWCAKSAMWAEDGHAAGWRLQPIGREVWFDLRVMSLDDDRDDVIERFAMEFDAAGALVKFNQLADEL